MKYSLKSRLVVIGLTLLLLIGLASVTLYSTANKYRFYNERSAHAQKIYSNYRAVSDHTYRKLSALGQIVEEGTLTNLQERYRNKEALRDALRGVRESIAAELSHVGDAAEATELEHFYQIELLAEEIIRGSELVRLGVEEGEPEAALLALQSVRGDSVEGTFNRLIDDAIFEELRELRETQLVAQELNQVLMRLLSVIFICFVILCALLLFSMWRALTHNLRIFETATNAYLDSDFSYRVPNNVAQEFHPLASALNTMSSEVESQRQRELTTQENLEAIIASRTDELQKTNKKLENISETRKQFLADISHELRTPLTIIQGEADLALRSKTNTPEQYDTAMHRIKEQTVHTNRFIQDLLFVARADDGKAPIHRRPILAAPIVAAICKDFALITGDRGIKIVEHYPEHDVLVNADASKLKQVITILLDNAVRYSYDDSVIEVHLQEVDENMRIQIIDTGIGLKYNEASQVFSRFYRGAEGSGKASGTGLGLPVAKAIMKAHGGSIKLEGEGDEGTTATMLLPIESHVRGVV